LHRSSRGRCRITPNEPAVLKVALEAAEASQENLQVEIRFHDRCLARCAIPLELPKREPPGRHAEPRTATDFAEAGWQDFLFARFGGAEAQFRKALASDPSSALAGIGLAFTQL